MIILILGFVVVPIVLTIVMNADLSREQKREFAHEITTEVKRAAEKAVGWIAFAVSAFVLFAMVFAAMGLLR